MVNCRGLKLDVMAHEDTVHLEHNSPSTHCLRFLSRINVFRSGVMVNCRGLKLDEMAHEDTVHLELNSLGTHYFEKFISFAAIIFSLMFWSETIKKKS